MPDWFVLRIRFLLIRNWLEFSAFWIRLWPRNEHKVYLLNFINWKRTKKFDFSRNSKEQQPVLIVIENYYSLSFGPLYKNLFHFPIGEAHNTHTSDNKYQRENERENCLMENVHTHTHSTHRRTRSPSLDGMTEDETVKRKILPERARWFFSVFGLNWLSLEHRYRRYATLLIFHACVP